MKTGRSVRNKPEENTGETDGKQCRAPIVLKLEHDVNSSYDGKVLRVDLAWRVRVAVAEASKV
jgi:hypothetical protein